MKHIFCIVVRTSPNRMNWLDWLAIIVSLGRLRVSCSQPVSLIGCMSCSWAVSALAVIHLDKSSHTQETSLGPLCYIPSSWREMHCFIFCNGLVLWHVLVSMKLLTYVGVPIWHGEAVPYVNQSACVC